MLHQNYWADKRNRSERAKKWTEYVEKKYNRYINESITKTEIYKEDHYFKPCLQGGKPEIKVLVTDTVSAIFDICNNEYYKKPCALNFASYKNPGGKFIEGSKAQEECLCHESTLYPVLNNFVTSYYMDNYNNKNNGLYLNRALYSPDILFIRENVSPVACSVLTCAAPNYTTAGKYGRVTKNDNSRTLKSRCKFILNIMEEKGIQTPILGAFGCGVFGQDAEEVANVFKDLLMSGNYHFKNVVFAVIEGPNADAFLRVFR